MAGITLTTFAGMVPSVDDRLLQEQNAKYVDNAWLYSGKLDAIPKRSDLFTLLSSTTEIAFRVPINDDDPTYLFNSKWVEFDNPDTDFLKAPTAGDSYQRYYWTSTSQVPRYNSKARILAGLHDYILGIPQADVTNVTAAGGVSATLVSRAYVATLVSNFGEEGPASEPFLIDGKIDDTFTAYVAGVAATDLGTNRDIGKIRLYRTVTSAAGTATYYLVHEFTASTSTQNFADTLTDADIANEIILESTSWLEPEDMDGFIAMPNGILAGYLDNNIYFSEPYRPHAWPPEYGIALDYDVVGLAVAGNSLIALTKGNPYAISGVHPSAMASTKLATFEPCISKGSIVMTENGCYYTSPNGLIMVGPGVVQNVTQQFISKDKWSQYVDKAKINASRLGSAYYAFGSGVSQFVQDDAFQQNAFQDENSDGTSEGFMIDPGNASAGFVVLNDTLPVKSLQNDLFSSELLLVRNGKVQWIDMRLGYERETYKWVSKTFMSPEVKNFAAFKVWFDLSGAVPSLAQNVDINQVFNPANQYGIVRVYCDNRLILAYELRTPGQLMRMPSGFKGTNFVFEFEARVKLVKFEVATTVKELSVA